MSPTTDVILLLPLLFLTSTCFKISRLMVVVSIEISETGVESYYSGLPVANHVAISWTLYSVVCMCCLNGNINYSL